MAEKDVAEQGSLAITARSDGNRWYGRVSIPENVAKEAGFQEGMRISAKGSNGRIIIQIDDKGPIKFPPKTGKGNPRYAFEAATTTLGLREMVRPQTPTKIIIEEGQIHLLVSPDLISTTQKPRKKNKKEPKQRSNQENVRAVFTPVTGTYGAAAAIITEANRQNKVVRPMTAIEIIRYLEENGHVVKPLGPRLFKLNDKKTVTVSDLQDLANKVFKGNESNKIVLIAD